MRIRWENVFALALVVLLVYLIVRCGKPVHALVTQAVSPSGWESQNQQITSLTVLGLILVTIVAIVRILVSGRQ